MGSGDLVSCFYCERQLFHWKLRDKPWYEHANWFPLCEFVLKKQGVKYVEKVCHKHLGLHRPNIENPIRSAATNQLRTMLTNQMQSTVATEQRSQKLEAMMLLDPDVKYAKSIGIEDTKIRSALLQRTEKNNCNFSNCQEVLNLVLNINKEDKCMKCKNKEKNAVCMPCGYMIFCWTCIQDIYSCWLLVVHSKLVRNNPCQTMVIAQELKTCVCSSSEKHQNSKSSILILNKLFLMKPELLKVLSFFFQKRFDRVKYNTLKIDQSIY